MDGPSEEETFLDLYEEVEYPCVKLVYGLKGEIK
jgi:hypothetical protein